MSHLRNGRSESSGGRRRGLIFGLTSTTWVMKGSRTGPSEREKKHEDGVSPSPCRQWTLKKPSLETSISTSPSTASVPGFDAPSFAFASASSNVGRGAGSSRTSNILNRLDRATTRLTTTFRLFDDDAPGLSPPREEGVRLMKTACSTPLGGSSSCRKPYMSGE